MTPCISRRLLSLSLSFPCLLLPLSHSPTSYHLSLLIDSYYPLHFLWFSCILLHSPSFSVPSSSPCSVAFRNFNTSGMTSENIWQLTVNWTEFLWSYLINSIFLRVISMPSLMENKRVIRTCEKGSGQSPLCASKLLIATVHVCIFFTYFQKTFSLYVKYQVSLKQNVEIDHLKVFHEIMSASAIHLERTCRVVY